jgi:hypothetical protein
MEPSPFGGRSSTVADLHGLLRTLRACPSHAGLMKGAALPCIGLSGQHRDLVIMRPRHRAAAAAAGCLAVEHRGPIARPRWYL